MAEKLVKVYPSSKLSDTEYLPGISPDGTEVTEAEAEALGALVQKSKPRTAGEPAEKPEE